MTSLRPSSAWTLPILIGAASLCALLAALALEGIWDVLSWGLLTTPFVFIGRALWPRRQGG